MTQENVHTTRWLTAPNLITLARIVGSPGMIVLAIALLVVGILSAALLRKDDIRFSAEPSDGSAGVAPVFDQVFLWLGYFGGVMAGLMVIGHAAGIAAVSLHQPEFHSFGAADDGWYFEAGYRAHKRDPGSVW